jgi:hypothetical protein
VQQLDAMSDIFISYSKADHALALQLSAFLEAEGWSVWWDKSLGAADLYRDEIMKQLAAARAVITIWTENSVKSDWVRAEAGRAKAEGKLIPVKTTDIAYADIPLPFGEMHTENVGSTDLIRAAIVAQLAKPAIPVSAFWQITGTFKYNVLTWIGIVGSAITVFANLTGILNLADWAQELVAHWHEWNQLIWGWVFNLIKVKVPKVFVPIISFIVFTIILVIGVNLSARTRTASVKSHHAMPAMVKAGVFVGGVLVYLSALGWVFIMAGIIVIVDPVHSDLFNPGGTISRIALLTALLIALIGAPIGYLLYFDKILEVLAVIMKHRVVERIDTPERSRIVIDSLLFLFMSGCLLIVPTMKIGEYGNDETSSDILWLLYMLSWLVLVHSCWMAVILFSPPKQLTRRLGFVVLGVLTLVALSEISKRNLHQYLQPPKVSENLVR